MKNLAIRLSLGLAAAAMLSAGLTAPAAAREGNSMGHGIKCYWVLVSSVNNVNTYQYVCRKGI